ncbi:MAG: hypothetical protein WBA93_13460, partial [Microcoleaceae cyanobacterium]
NYPYRELPLQRITPTENYPYRELPLQRITPTENYPYRVVISFRMLRKHRKRSIPFLGHAAQTEITRTGFRRNQNYKGDRSRNYPLVFLPLSAQNANFLSLIKRKAGTF